MPYFLTVHTASGRIQGWQAVTSRTTVPENTENRSFVVVTDEQMAEIQQVHKSSRYGALWDLQAGTVSAAPDNRPHLRISARPIRVTADGVDTCRIDVAVLNKAGSVAQSVNRDQLVPFGDRMLLVPVVNGEGSKQITFDRSGYYTFDSTDEIRIESPVTVQAVE